MKRLATIDLPLHDGHAPQWLINLMKELGYEISNIIIKEYGTEEFLRRISDPLWFQSLGCLLGYDWHSSGVTTVLTGVLKSVLNDKDLGLAVAGGKGKLARKTPEEINIIAKKLDLEEPQKFQRISRLVAKIDTALIQSGHELYHHTMFIDYKGNWAIIQQGMNVEEKKARRYHWFSGELKDFVNEPHKAIVGESVNRKVLNMVAKESEENRRACVDLVNEGVEKIRSSIRELYRGPLDKWLYEGKVRHYEMPLEINWEALKKLYENKPRNYLEIAEFKGVGPKTIRALALVSEIIFGTPASWRDPVKFTFAHGGKDGVPYPVDKKVYRRTISIIKDAIERSKLGSEEKLLAFKRLAQLELI